ncbi:hypothetical protein BWD42_07625 [Sphingobacterium sp. CZ-UAM]|uniref:Ig-like domain-containing protein n=1 Tax=Sphingobacterium sp. CZ-UAM TaxID=1933868 RepID=UPI000984908E|nr:Ig-like domain-containing protein [Sphingobacterium sp. CZ-UAM]OOG19760.1 hypothetical protein BWD42_07625 [Sphingobacterium sp. CZ-UAM]
MKEILSYNKLFFAIGALVIVASCKKDEISGTGLSLKEAKYANNRMEISLKDNETLKLTAILTPGNQTTTAVTYSNKHPEIMSVSSDGLITAKSVGLDTLTVSAQSGPQLQVSYVVNILKH